jgi:hypothetical protein
MSKAIYNSHGWIVKSYETIMADMNFRVKVIRDGVLREVRMYGPKPPIVGESISLHRE